MKKQDVDSTALIKQAVAFLNAGEFEKSKHLAEKIILVNANDFSARLILGASYASLGQPEKAVRELSAAVHLNPKSGQAKSQLAAALMNADRYRDAVKVLLDITRADPSNAQAFNNLGLAYFNSEQFELAETAFERATELAPDTLSSLVGLIQTYAKTGNRKGAERWHTALAMPAFKKPITADTLDIMGEVLDAYYDYQRIEDSEDRYTGAVVPAIQAYSKNVRAFVGAQAQAKRDSRSSLSEAGEPIKVAFFIDYANNLAHSKNLYMYLTALLRQTDYKIEPTLIYYKKSDALNFEDYGIENIDRLELPKGMSRIELILWLKGEIDRRGISVCVTLGTISSLFALSFVCKIAPVMMWWSQKHHGLTLDSIDGYLTLGSVAPTRMIDGREWRTIVGLFGPSTFKVQSEDVRAKALSIRTQLLGAEYKQILGVFGREEKLDNDAYWDCVSSIIERFPEALFIWSGRHERKSIIDRMSARNLEHRCKFAGWVDTQVYVNVIDLYVDSFPFPGGHTVVEAMLADTPVVSLVTDDARRITASIFAEPWIDETSSHAEELGLEPIFTDSDGNDLSPFVFDIDAYVGCAISILSDTPTRQKRTNASRVFVEKYLTNFELAGTMLAQHIIDVRNQHVST